jgi:hypothetical protein
VQLVVHLAVVVVLFEALADDKSVAIGVDVCGTNEPRYGRVYTHRKRRAKKLKH